MSMTDECVVVGCKLRNKTHGYCMAQTRFDGQHPLACEFGRFSRILQDQVGDTGDWKVFQYVDGPCRATLTGKLGTVEVWGGAHHADEVWFIERTTKDETLICKPWAVTDGSLRDAVARGCAMAGIQTRLGI